MGLPLSRAWCPRLLAPGSASVVPDLVGFGRSTNRPSATSYTYAGHVAWLAAFVADARPRRHHAVLPGLGRAARPARRRRARPRAVRAPRHRQHVPPRRAPAERGRSCSGSTPVGHDVPRAARRSSGDGWPATRTGRARGLPRARSRTRTHMAGARQFPLLVPTGPDDPAVAANLAACGVLEASDDPVLALGRRAIPCSSATARVRTTIPGAAGHPHQTFAPAGPSSRTTVAISSPQRSSVGWPRLTGQRVARPACPPRAEDGQLVDQRRLLVVRRRGHHLDGRDRAGRGAAARPRTPTWSDRVGPATGDVRNTSSPTSNAPAGQLVPSTRRCATACSTSSPFATTGDADRVPCRARGCHVAINADWTGWWLTCAKGRSRSPAPQVARCSPACGDLRGGQQLVRGSAQADGDAIL